MPSNYEAKTLQFRVFGAKFFIKILFIFTKIIYFYYFFKFSLGELSKDGRNEEEKKRHSSKVLLFGKNIIINKNIIL